MWRKRVALFSNSRWQFSQLNIFASIWYGYCGVSDDTRHTRPALVLETDAGTGLGWYCIIFKNMRPSSCTTYTLIRVGIEVEKQSRPYGYVDYFCILITIDDSVLFNSFGQILPARVDWNFSILFIQMTNTWYFFYFWFLREKTKIIYIMCKILHKLFSSPMAGRFN